MASITFRHFFAGVGIDYRELSPSGLFEYDFSIRSPTVLRLYDNATNFTQFGGASFTYTLSAGRITDVRSGIVSSINYTVSGVPIVLVTGASISAPALYDTAAANNARAMINLIFAGHDVVNGTIYEDYLTGGGGNDVVNGNTGDDFLFGGVGNDALVGGAGIDRLFGEAGNDVLSGGLGSDVLIGSLGKDTFVFNTALGPANVDTISGYSVADDTIRLENTGVFTALAGGFLPIAAFHRGAAAHDPSDRVIFNPLNGALMYDPDGTGSAAAIRFGTLTGVSGLLTNADFFVV